MLMACAGVLAQFVHWCLGSIVSADMPTKAPNGQRQRRRNKLVVKNHNRPAPKALKKTAEKKTHAVPAATATPIVGEKRGFPIAIETNGDHANGPILINDPIFIEAGSKGDKPGNPIAIDSNGDNADNPLLINPEGEDDDIEITWLQQCEMEERNEANNAVNLISICLPDNDSSDEESDEEELFPSFWPVLQKMRFHSLTPQPLVR
ncbi:hypothetical protein MJO28_011397 [Puccinia striiformis f. sp. tritici]|uniref:Uncharacterized protein n=1 Tax=Puccinia striiformis f. sp. tritici TaxID=168172 RepID=A0ACC0E3L7_9BASI|nr:hypothetical protein MJO28_011397 [Puccinia striiformis f. sp. tritici]